MKRITLHAARHKAGLTQEQLEAITGVPQAVISRLERRSDIRPLFDHVVALATALNVDPLRLKFGRSQPESVAS